MKLESDPLTVPAGPVLQTEVLLGFIKHAIERIAALEVRVSGLELSLQLAALASRDRPTSTDP